MNPVTAADPQPLHGYDHAVREAYAAAVAAGWTAPSRAPLWQAAVEAVLAYAATAPDAAAGRRYHHLMVDLASDASPAVMAAWNRETQRAVRLAATHTLSAPSKPHHRPRAQSLLKRLELMASPVLTLREHLLVALSKQRQALTAQRAAGTGNMERRLGPGQLQIRQHLLSRLTEVARDLPRAGTTPSSHPLLAIRLERLIGLVESGAGLEPGHWADLFEAVQHVQAPERSDVPLGQALAALECVRQQNHPGVAASRHMLLAMLFDLTVADHIPQAAEALERHLADITHVGDHLLDIPETHLPAILFRLKHRLSDPTNDALEPIVDEALALLETLERHREDATDTVDALTGEGAVEERQDLIAARQRLREVDALIAAVHELNLRRVGAAEGGALRPIFRQIEALAGPHPLDPEAFSQTRDTLADQLARPALIGHQAWQAGRTALQQLNAQRRQLEETRRGLALDRHLDGPQRNARQHLLQRQIDALDQARQVFGSLAFERVGDETEALAAIADFTRAARQAVTGPATTQLKRALDRAVAACSK